MSKDVRHSYLWSVYAPNWCDLAPTHSSIARFASSYIPFFPLSPYLNFFLWPWWCPSKQATWFCLLLSHWLRSHWLCNVNTYKTRLDKSYLGEQLCYANIFLLLSAQFLFSAFSCVGFLFMQLRVEVGWLYIYLTTSGMAKEGREQYRRMNFRNHDPFYWVGN